MIGVDELRNIGWERLAREVHGSNQVPDRILRFEVDVLLASLLGCTRTQLLMRKEVEEHSAERFRVALDRRITGEPLSYILGEQDFFGLPFAVNRDVLIPRPETELLVQRAVAIAAQMPQPFTVIDIGTGSGAIALAMAHEMRRGRCPSATVVGIDCSLPALRLAVENGRRLGSEVHFVAGDLLTPVAVLTDRDRVLIVANLPYVADGEILPHSVEAFEPSLALRGGRSGTEIIERCIGQLQRLGGKQAILFEVGFGQAAQIGETLEAAGYEPMSVIRDYAGIDRIVETRRALAE